MRAFRMRQRCMATRLVYALRCTLSEPHDLTVDREYSGESYANDTEAWYRIHTHPARAHLIRRSVDSRGIMQFAHGTYGNTRFPCAVTKLQTRVFHSSSSFDDSAVTMGPDVVSDLLHPAYIELPMKSKYKMQSRGFVQNNTT